MIPKSDQDLSMTNIGQKLEFRELKPKSIGPEIVQVLTKCRVSRRKMKKMSSPTYVHNLSCTRITTILKHGTQNLTKCGHLLEF